MKVPVSSLISRKNDNFEYFAASCPHLSISSSVLVLCRQSVLHLRTCLKMFSFVSCFWIFCPVFTVVVQFNSCQYQLQIQWSFDELVPCFRVVYCGCKFGGAFFSGVILLYWHFLSIFTSFFHYSSTVSLSSSLILKNWALL